MALRDLINFNRPFSFPRDVSSSLGSLQNEMNRLFRDFLGGSSALTPQSFDFPPIVDVCETDKDFKIRAELAGINNEDVEVNLTESVLTIKGQKQIEKDEEKENYITRECSYGSFERRFSLPSSANADQAKAYFEKGVLTVVIPKKAESAATVKKVKIEGKGGE